ncbi:MAG: SAM-dependent methyltransferase [Bacteroidaceae bacterium]|nr:SAM-dependent methyltransferase [Bacteroidaceae bacterium]
MITSDKINQLLGIDESYKASTVLMDILGDSQKRETLADQFINEESDLTFDWFTNYFQEEHSDRKNKKQDFTPDEVVQLVDKLSGDFNANVDICAGTGGLTIKKWNRNKNGYFYCEEFSDRAIPFLMFNLMLRNVDGFIFHGDSLTRNVKHLYRLTSGNKFSDIQEVNELDTATGNSVVMNPPYSLKWEPTKEMLNQDRFKEYDVLAPKTKADYAFLLQGLSNLNDNGTMAIVLPHGVLFRGSAEEKIRKRLIELNYLDTVIGLPEKLFYNTDIPTVILILKKKRTNNDVLFVDASREFEKVKPHNKLTDENISKIVKTVNERVDVEKYSYVAALSELKENDFNLNIPRYVDTFEPEPIKPLHEIMQEMKRVDEEINKVSERIGRDLLKLRGTNPDDDREIKEFTKYWVDKYNVADE